MIRRGFEIIGLVVILLAPTIGSGKSSLQIGSLNDKETGNGAGCFFYAEIDKNKNLVFVDRDDYGWVMINGIIEKTKPTTAYVMWPSKKGETLVRQYRSQRHHVELSLRVESGCNESDDNCAAEYRGRIILTTVKQKVNLEVTGHCAG